MGMNGCDCEKGVRLCPVAEKLWRAYRAAVDVEETLFARVLSRHGEDDPIAHDRHRLAGEVKRASLRMYERHVDGDNEPFTPEPQSLKAPLMRVVS